MLLFSNGNQSKRKTKQNLWNFRSLNVLSYSLITFTGVFQRRWWTTSVSALCHIATSSYSITVHTPCPASPKFTQISTVSLSKLKLTLHLSMCIKAAYSIAWGKLFLKQLNGLSHLFCPGLLSVVNSIAYKWS